VGYIVRGVGFRKVQAIEVNFDVNEVVIYSKHCIDPVISFFRLSVSLCLCQSVVERLRPHYYSLPIFTTFCMRDRNVVISTLLYVGLPRVPGYLSGTRVIY